MLGDGGLDEGVEGSVYFEPQGKPAAAGRARDQSLSAALAFPL